MFPTPTDVKDLPLGGAIALAFAAVSDAKMQARIDSAAKLLGSEEVKLHTQRDEAVLYLTAHLLYLELRAQGLISGGGGGGGNLGVLTSVSLQGVGSKSFGISTQTVDDLNDWLKAWSPWSVPLHAILDTFPPSIITTQGGIPETCT